MTEVDVQNLVDTMSAKLSPKSVHDRHAILHGIFKWAAAPKQRYVTGDPCIGTELPKKRKKKPKGFRPNEWVAFYAAVRTINPDGADLVDFMLASGWRWSEAIALTRWDVEDNGVDVWVNMAQVIRRNAASQHVVVKDAKNDSSMERRIKLDQSSGDLLRRRVGNRPGDGLVFTTANGNQWHYSNFRRGVWDPARKVAGLEDRGPTPHWTRHTHIGWMLMGGTGMSGVQHRVGHTSPVTTDGYATMIDDVPDEALAGFAQMRLGSLRVPELPPAD